MRVFLTKPVKIKGEWHKSNTEIDVAGKEGERLAKKGACVIPMTETPKPKTEKKD